MTVLFDLDGTLEDSRADMIASTNRVRTQLGLRARDPDELRPDMSRGMKNLYLVCFDEIIDNEYSPELEEVRRLYEADYYEHICVETKLYRGIEAALEELSGHARLGVVTNKPEEHSVALLSRLGIASYFDVVVGGDTCGIGKPSPIPLKHAAKALKSEGPVVMIGDSGGDIEMAKAAGAFSIWCAWGYAPAPPGQHAPDMIARTPDALLSLVKGVL